MPEAPHEAAARSRAGGARTRLVRDAVGCDEPGQATESSSDDEISVEQAMLTSAVVCSENNASIDQRDPSVSAKSHARSTPRSHSTLFKQSTASSTSATAHSASSLPAEEDYNSADEHEMALSGADSEERERSFEALCAQRGLQIKQMFRDGNCMFRCVADRVYGDADMHDVVRKLCMDYIAKERDYFSPYITQDFESYVQRKRRNGVFGNHVELQAISELFSRPVEVYAYSAIPISTFQAANEAADAAGAADSTTQAAATAEPLRLSYHGHNHYNLLLDPTRADVGVGLGLPGFEPGRADAEQVERAARESEQEALDRDLLRLAADDSDAAATTAAIEAELMRVSYQEAMRAQQQSEQQGASFFRAQDPGLDGPWNSQIEQMVSMGFLRERAEEAATVFDGDLPSMIEYLTDRC